MKTKKKKLSLLNQKIFALMNLQNVLGLNGKCATEGASIRLPTELGLKKHKIGKKKIREKIIIERLHFQIFNSQFTFLLIGVFDFSTRRARLKMSCDPHFLGHKVRVSSFKRIDYPPISMLVGPPLLLVTASNVRQVFHRKHKKVKTSRLCMCACVCVRFYCLLSLLL